MLLNNGDGYTMFEGCAGPAGPREAGQPGADRLHHRDPRRRDRRGVCRAHRPGPHRDRGRAAVKKHRLSSCRGRRLSVLFPASLRRAAGFLYQHSVAVVDLVLDDLGRPALSQVRRKNLVMEADRDLAIGLRRRVPVSDRQPSSVRWAVQTISGVEHHQREVFPSRNVMMRLRLADHVGSHLRRRRPVGPSVSRRSRAMARSAAVALAELCEEKPGLL